MFTSSNWKDKLLIKSFKKTENCKENEQKDLLNFCC